MKPLAERIERRTMPAERPRKQRPKLCESCGKHPVDPPSKECSGCEAYREHQWT